MKKLLLVILSVIWLGANAQETNGEKKLWAKSFLNQKAPELIVEQWITPKPETEGKFVLIDFWATWCAPCRKAIPELNSFHKLFTNDLVVIGLSKETAEKVISMKEPVIEYSSAIDTKSRTYTAFGVKGIPHCVLIDPNGVVRWEGFPMLEGYELTEKVIRELITKYKTSNLLSTPNKTTISIEELSELVNESNEIAKMNIIKEVQERQSKLIEKYKEHQFTLEDFDNLQFTKVKDFNYSKTIRLIFYPSLDRISKERSVNGARAAYLKMSYYPYDESKNGRYDNEIKRVNLYEECTNHPSFAELVSADNKLASSIFSFLQILNTTAMKQTHLLDGIYSALKFNRSFDVSTGAASVFNVISSNNLGLAKDSVEAFRKLISTKTKEAIDSIETYPEKYATNEKLVNKIKSSFEFLNSSFAKGEFLNNPAPEIEFIWCSNADIKRLSDTKGKVTIIDFWATWCGPCVRSFGNMRELQERYKDYQVTIIGVTSIQGSHTDRKNNIKIDTKGDPDKELSFMPTFIKDMDITWNIAFSKNTVFNSSYGVSGIPHVAIIDANGKVRYNGLNPNNNPSIEAEKIDALLKEAGLQFPTSPMTKNL
jgi:thiol-disulfide isomerase/thioredoxin